MTNISISISTIDKYWINRRKDKFTYTCRNIQHRHNIHTNIIEKNTQRCPKGLNMHIVFYKQTIYKRGIKMEKKFTWVSWSVKFFELCKLYLSITRQETLFVLFKEQRQNRMKVNFRDYHVTYCETPSIHTHTPKEIIMCFVPKSDMHK